MGLISELNVEVINLCRPFIVEDEILAIYGEKFMEELNTSLNGNQCTECSLKCYLSYINDLPHGKEEGSHIILAVEETKYVLMFVKLKRGKYEIESRSHDIPQSLSAWVDSRLYRRVAFSLNEFIQELEIVERRIPMGVISCFPIQKHNLQHARAVSYDSEQTKKNPDIHLKLKKAFRKYDRLKRIYLIHVNNVVCGVLISSAWQEQTTRVAIDIGQCFNMCYLEQTRRINSYDGDETKTQVLVNVYTPNFYDENVFNMVRNTFDEELDMSSKNPGLQLNEKMISAKYLGELSRLLLVSAIKSGLILGGWLSEEIQKEYSFSTAQMMRIERDANDCHDNCHSVLAEMGYKDVPSDDCVQIQFICRCVSRRSAHLTAACICVLMSKVKEDMITVAASGCMIDQYPNYGYYITRKLMKLSPKKFSVNKENIAKEVGAALISAAVADKIMDMEDKCRSLPPVSGNNCLLDPV